MRAELSTFSEYVRGYDRKAQCQFRGECLVGLAAYAVSPEELPH